MTRQNTKTAMMTYRRTVAELVFPLSPTFGFSVAGDVGAGLAPGWIHA
jgi:hypothetical protein